MSPRLSTHIEAPCFPQLQLLAQRVELRPSHADPETGDHRPNPNTTKPTDPPTPYFPPPIPDCPMASAVALRHAEMLTGAGFDYIAVDITNWPQVCRPCWTPVFRVLSAYRYVRARLMLPPMSQCCARLR